MGTALFRRFLKQVEAIVFPQRFQCLICHTLTNGAWLCVECAKKLHAERFAPEARCTHVKDVDVRAVWAYQDIAKDLVHQLKFHAVSPCANVLAEGICEVLHSLPLSDDTVLTWVVMPRSRRNERGIDHGHTLCQAVSALAGFPCRSLLRRTRAAHTQIGLSRDERLRNLAGVFTCAEPITGTIVLIDDVTTTGATSVSCAHALRDGGAKRVFVVTATRA